jgi:hypothetical protein
MQISGWETAEWVDNGARPIEYTGPPVSRAPCSACGSNDV